MRKAVADCRDTPQDVITKLVDDSDELVRSAAFGRTELVKELRGAHSTYLIRSDVAGNPHCPPELLE
nr:hypothetical protein GCM10020241_57530 [Streptoalloteichus tenebrarius]